MPRQNGSGKWLGSGGGMLQVLARGYQAM